MMKAIYTYETQVSFYQTARRNIPEDSHFEGGHVFNYVSQWIAT
jgi:hypothetical protein